MTRYRCSECKLDLGPTDTHHVYATLLTSYPPQVDYSSLYMCNVKHKDAVAETIPVDPRLDRDELFMQTAHLFAKRSTCLRAHVGAVLVKDKRIISNGYNGSPPGAAHCTELGCLPGADSGCIRTTHAEVNAIYWAARVGISTQGALLYCTHEPCLNCAKAIATAGIKMVMYVESYREHLGLELLTQLEIPVIQMQGQL